ncbi:hypothetical protein DIRU0_E07294 [Diutina rugosa]
MSLDKPRPLKVYGRSHYACSRCKLAKTRCSGERPSCSNCVQVNKADQCVYPSRDRKVVIMESELDNLHRQVQHLKTQVAAQPTPGGDMWPYDSMEDVNSSQLRQSLVATVRSQLPCKPEEAARLVERAYHAYSLEFYLVRLSSIAAMLDHVYHVASPETYPYAPPPPLYPTHDTAAMSPWRHFQQLSAYILALVAFGKLLDTEEPVENNRYPGSQCYLLAEQLLRVNTEHTTFVHIQTALVLGLYAANFNRFNTCYNLIGIALRSAVALNLHRHRELLPTATISDRAEAERAKRLWWSVFVLDTIWSIKTVHFQYTDTDVDLPLDNAINLKEDSFDNGLLEDNVHLAKHIAKISRLIYGPNIRTFSVNYINSAEFTQKQLLLHILNSFDTMQNDFEECHLWLRKRQHILEGGIRAEANLFLRYHQALIILSKPIFPLLHEPLLQSLIEENRSRIELLTQKCVAAAIATIEIITTIRSQNLLFKLGFWEAQYVFMAMIMLLVARTRNIKIPSFVYGMSLLRHMAHYRNINAITCLKRLDQMMDLLQANGMPLVPASETDVTPVALEQYCGYLPSTMVVDMPTLGWFVPNPCPGNHGELLHRLFAFEELTFSIDGN